MQSISRLSLCILGCGGFIGSHLVDRLLSTTDARITGIDWSSGKIARFMGHRRFSYVNMDVTDSRALRPYIEQCDTVISLAALCNPSLYNTVPLDVIASNFTQPLEVVKLCSELRKWLIHFSTCEVYGKTAAATAGGEDNAEPFNEDTTPMIMGPVGAQRWSYATAKQLLERVIYAHGAERDLEYTIVRPFNFIGAHMDFIPGIDGSGVPRVLACFMDALLFNKPLKLVDGGHNRRSFTYIDDAIDALTAMLANPARAKGEIFNIGHPKNELSIAELARLMVKTYQELLPQKADLEYSIVSVSSEQFYGAGYEDSDRRVPDIAKAKRLLGWEPKTEIGHALRLTMQAYIEEYGATGELRAAL